MVHNAAWNYWYLRFRPVMFTGHVGYTLYSNITNTFNAVDDTSNSKLTAHALWNYDTLKRYDSLYLSKVQLQIYIPQDAPFALVLKKFSKGFTVNTDGDQTRFLSYTAVYTEFDDRVDSNQILLPQYQKMIRYTHKNKYHEGLLYSQVS